jgi:hypothetical protein
MPLAGVVDPSHDERAASDDGRLPKWLPLDEVLHHAATGDPKWSPWPYELLNAAIGAHQERDYISVTMLTGGCGRGKVLERRADYIGDVDSMYAALKGTQIHRTLEHAARPGAVAEFRFFTNLRVGSHDVELSCSPDTVIYEGETGIWDWKTTENPPTFGYPWKSHDRQLQYNRWLVNHAHHWVDADGEETNLPFSPWDVVFKHLAIVYLGPKGPKVIEVTKTREVQTPNNRTVKRKMPFVWSDDDVMDDMMPRLKAMVLALDAYPEWPDGLTDQPGFEGPPGWGCPGKPWCSLPNCLAKRYPNGLIWEAS